MEIIYVIIALAAIVIGFLIGIYVSGIKKKSALTVLESDLKNLENSRKELFDRHSKIETEKNEIQEERDQLNIRLAALKSDYDHLTSDLEKERTRFTNFEKDFNEKFENLAHKIMVEKTEKFTQANQQNIENILKPLNEKIKAFEEKVGKTNEDFIRGHAQLGKQLEMLNEQNVKISEEANNLTRALKGESKTQGNWGELILERVLERSNLVKDREYFVQQVFQDEDGKKQIPDVVIHLPNGKKMIIDSKVSLRAYERYTNEEDASLRKNHLKEHIRALNEHINSLSSKKYEDLLKDQAPDFVLMFVAIEPALYLAQNEDTSFFYTAFQKNILLVSPTTLLSTLRTIDALWTNEKQHQNAMEIAKHASSLYHKFQNLIEELDVVGSRIDASQKAYHSAMKKLTGNQNLVKDIVKLEELGIATKERIAEKWRKDFDDDDTELPEAKIL